MSMCIHIIAQRCKFALIPKILTFVVLVWLDLLRWVKTRRTVQKSPNPSAAKNRNGKKESSWTAYWLRENISNALLAWSSLCWFFDWTWTNCFVISNTSLLLTACLWICCLHLGNQNRFSGAFIPRILVMCHLWESWPNIAQAACQNEALSLTHNPTELDHAQFQGGLAFYLICKLRYCAELMQLPMQALSAHTLNQLTSASLPAELPEVNTRNHETKHLLKQSETNRMCLKPRLSFCLMKNCEDSSSKLPILFGWRSVRELLPSTLHPETHWDTWHVVKLHKMCIWQTKSQVKW